MAAQLQLMAGQIDSLANQILEKAKKQNKKKNERKLKHQRTLRENFKIVLISNRFLRNKINVQS